jgi:hypothetical protein
MAEYEELLDESGAPLAAFRAGKAQELFDREVTGMRRDEIKEASLGIAVAEGAKRGELLGRWTHGLYPENRCA